MCEKELVSSLKKDPESPICKDNTIIVLNNASYWSSSAHNYGDPVVKFLPYKTVAFTSREPLPPVKIAYP